jgi:hypothetical protein
VWSFSGISLTFATFGSLTPVEARSCRPKLVVCRGGPIPPNVAIDRTDRLSFPVQNNALAVMLGPGQAIEAMLS